MLLLGVTAIFVFQQICTSCRIGKGFDVAPQSKQLTTHALRSSSQICWYPTFSLPHLHGRRRNWLSGSGNFVHRTFNLAVIRYPPTQTSVSSPSSQSQQSHVSPKSRLEQQYSHTQYLAIYNSSLVLTHLLHSPLPPVTVQLWHESLLSAPDPAYTAGRSGMFFSRSPPGCTRPWRQSPLHRLLSRERPEP